MKPITFCTTFREASFYARTILHVWFTHGKLPIVIENDLYFVLNKMAPRIRQYFLQRIYEGNYNLFEKIITSTALNVIPDEPEPEKEKPAKKSRSKTTEEMLKLFNEL